MAGRPRAPTAVIAGFSGRSAHGVTHRDGRQRHRTGLISPLPRERRSMHSRHQTNRPDHARCLEAGPLSTGTQRPSSGEDRGKRDLRRPGRTIISLLSMALLALESVWTRLFSAELYHAYAFLVLSLAILGLGLGALAVRLAPVVERRSYLGVVLSLSAVAALGPGPSRSLRCEKGMAFAQLTLESEGCPNSRTASILNSLANFRRSLFGFMGTAWERHTPLSGVHEQQGSSTRRTERRGAVASWDGGSASSMAGSRAPGEEKRPCGRSAGPPPHPDG
jgi:hypothetical protein